MVCGHTATCISPPHNDMVFALYIISNVPNDMVNRHHDMVCGHNAISPPHNDMLLALYIISTVPNIISFPPYIITRTHTDILLALYIIIIVPNIIS